MRSLLVVLGTVVALGACSGSDPAASPSPARSVDSMGQELFAERVVGSNPGCVTCHSLQEGITIVGPSLYRVVSPVAGMSNHDYVRESILDPDQYIVDGFSAGQMSSGWGDYLTEDQIESLVVLLADG